MQEECPFPRLDLSQSHLEAILPACLRKLQQWVIWKPECREGKWTKVPVNARTLHNAKSNASSTWTSFRHAVDVHHTIPWSSGIGFVFTDSDPFVGVDLDHCINGNGEIALWAQRIVDHHPTYAEVSPSGTGIKLICSSTRQVGDGRRAPDWPVVGSAVEVYDRGRFFTITGATLGFHEDVVDCTDAVAGLVSELPRKEKPARAAAAPPPPLDLDDNELMARAMAAKNGAALRRLWEGDITGYGSQSEADLALCSLLAFWTGPDPERVDRLFRQSGLAREKWEREDYRQDTLARAVRREAFYEAPRPVVAPPPAATTTTGYGHPEQPVMASDEEAYYESILAAPEPPAAPPAPALQPEQPQTTLDRKPVGSLGGIVSSVLAQEHIPPMKWSIVEMLPEGYNILSGRPKQRKSFLALQFALAIARGDRIWGRETQQGPVLYLALEDGPRRMQARQRQLLNGRTPPDCLCFFFAWPRWDDGGSVAMDEWLTAHPGTRMVIIDTWAKIEPASKKNGDQYRDTYATLSTLQSLAFKHGLCLLTITHKRKPSKENGGDFLDDVIGSTAITGAADTIMGLKVERGKDNAELEITGRDVPESEIALSWEEDGWQVRSQLEVILQNPLAKAVVALTMERGEWVGKIGELFSELESRLEGRRPLSWPSDAKKLGYTMRSIGPMLWDIGISYRVLHQRGGNVVELIVRDASKDAVSEEHVVHGSHGSQATETLLPSGIPCEPCADPHGSHGSRPDSVNHVNHVNHAPHVNHVNHGSTDSGQDEVLY